METTRHFTTNVFVVNDGAVALDCHPKLEIYLPPGGYIERDELPHTSAKREVREEIGLDSEIVKEMSDVEVPGGRPIPEPEHFILYDVEVDSEGEVAHQHIDLIYYAEVDSREINPEEDEVPADEWEWYTEEDLRSRDFDPDTEQMAMEAIDKVKG